MGLTQHVTGPTHNDGHTLNLIITRSFDGVVSTKPVVDTYVSDHASILCDIDYCKPVELFENVSYRKIKSIDIDALRDQVTASELCTKDFSDLEELVACYNSTLAGLLDTHAPVITKTVVKRKCVPWFNNDIRHAIRLRRASLRMQEIAQITLCSPRGGNTFVTSSVRTARIRLNCSSLLRPCSVNHGTYPSRLM